MFLLLLLFLIINGNPIHHQLVVSKLPVVLMHGILSNENKMSELKFYLEIEFNVNVIVPEIGNGKIDSLIYSIDRQGKLLCDNLNSNELLSSGFNFIGMSQGGILGRYYIQNCGKYNVNNFITLVTPHGGIFNNLDYESNEISFLSYWRNPYHLNEYYKYILLAELNNEVITSNSNKYKTKMLSLNNFIMVYSPYDKVLSPPESGKFSTYKDESMDIIPMNQTKMYSTLGLNEMDMGNKINIFQTNCSHSQHKEYNCFKYLHNMFVKYI
jgi:hypothetical protein